MAIIKITEYPEEVLAQVGKPVTEFDAEQGFLGVAELLGRLNLKGGKIIEYPAVLEVRLFGFSKMKTARTIFGHLKLLSRLSKMRLFGKTQEIKNPLPKDNLKPQINTDRHR